MRSRLGRASAAGFTLVEMAISTAILVVAGRVARSRAQSGAGGYFVGGRGFSPALVAFCITQPKESHS